MGKRELASYRDSQDLPRAWATGHDKKAVAEKAREHLLAYIQEKNALGYGLKKTDFTLVWATQKEMQEAGILLTEKEV